MIIKQMPNGEYYVCRKYNRGLPDALFLIKYNKIHVNSIHFTNNFIGKRVRLKVEVV